MDENPYKAPVPHGSVPRRSKSTVLDKTLVLNLAMLCLTVSAAMLSFGVWGTFTEAGRHRFDEMDGMIPFFAICASSVPALGAVALFVVIWKRR
jgi:hypothetical protein